MDLVSRRHWFFLFSLLVMIPGVVFFIIAPGLKPGIDFTGGSTLTLAFENEVSQTDLRISLSDIGNADSTVQKLEDKLFFIRTVQLTTEAKDSLINHVKSLSPDGIQVLSFDLVSPIIAQETVVNALWAVLAASVGIFLYVWWAFRNVPSPFRYGAAAIIALIHDTFIVIGIFAILGMLLDIEVNTMFLVALLTVIGYSVNDTIVVFDRIRENVLIYPNRGFADVVNLSILETLGRSLNTSLTLLFVLLALFLFGGTTIRNFLLVLLIGVVAGTYSSIGIASQVLVSWEYGDLRRLWRKLTLRSVTAR